MTDRVYPSSKPTTTQTLNGTTATNNPSFPATKAQLYGATRPAYRPQPHPRRRRYRRSCCCACCIWTILLLIALLLLAAIAGAVLWVLYRPHRPTFSVSSLRIKSFNVTSSQLNSNFDLTASSRNPNKKLKFFYDPITVSVYTSRGINVGEGSFPAFVHGTKNTTLMKASLSSSGLDLDTASISSLRSDLKTKSRLTLKVRLETKVKVKMGGLKSNKVGIRVSCDGIQATVPTGKSPVTASTSDAKCKANLRIKIWKWTF